MTAIYHTKNLQNFNKDFFNMRVYYDVRLNKGNSGIYIFGGQNKSSEAVNGLYMLKLSENRGENVLEWYKPETTGTQPMARYGHIACHSGDYLYVFGGRDDSNWRYTNQ
jgi:hypothetical protein